MADRLFQDRRAAGRALAGLLCHYRDRTDVIVLGLPRGGVPVAHEVAQAIGAPLDVFLVRKLGVPGREELAMGAVAFGHVVVLNDDVLRALGVSGRTVSEVAERERAELRRRDQIYRGGRPIPDLTDRTVILVDDGLATGASMRAAIHAARQLGPARVVVAVPTAPASVCEELAHRVDELRCVQTPSPFFAVGASYQNFEQVSDEEVRALVRAATPSRGPARATSERSKVMAETGYSSFNTTVDKTNHVLREIEHDYGWPKERRNQSCAALRATLHALRDRLSVQEAAQLGAQLPMLVRGMYYEGWEPSRVPVKMSRQEFLDRIQEEFRFDIDGGIDQLAYRVMAALRQHITEGEWADVKSALPNDLEAVLP